MDVALVIKIPDPDRGSVRQAMAVAYGNQDLFTKQRHGVGAFVGLTARKTVDGNLKTAIEKLFLQLPGVRVTELQLYPRMVRLDRADERDDLVWSDSAHYAQFQDRLFELSELFRDALRGLSGFGDLREMGTDHLPELREMRVGTLAMKQKPSEFLFQALDRASQGWLADVTLLGRLGEIR
jgi:hypothetical protein